MRIITGCRRGLKLKTPKGMDIRPTTDRVKESVFNIIGGRVIEATVLDCFAGTGNLGLEALSRGADKVIYTDNSSISLKLAKANAELAKLADKAEFYRMDAAAAIGTFVAKGLKFDLIFCDPPYNRGLVLAILRKIDAADILRTSGLIVVEHSKHEPVAEDLLNLQETRLEHYGETMVSFLTRTVD
ncbi:MAG: methyltransferase [Firmicutes bacterium]|nr:methyltransferase [Bacillota bacterium]